MRFFFALFVLLPTSQAFAGRKIVRNILPLSYTYLTAYNASAIPQTVDIVIRGIGGLTTSYDPACLGSPNTTCPSATECRNKSNLRVLAPGQAVLICTLNGGSFTSGYGQLVEVSVAEDRGIVVASGEVQLAGSAGSTSINVPVPFDVNGARPF